MAIRDKQRHFAKIVVSFERRDDGGLRAFSDDVPGSVLSHKDPLAVIKDVAPVLERILSAMWGVSVKAEPLPHVGEPIENEEMPESVITYADHREYVAHVS